MNVSDELRQEAAALISGPAKISKKQALVILENPPEGINADLAFPCFVLTKLFKDDPVAIARASSPILANVDE